MQVEFSKRTQWDLGETPWARLLAAMRAQNSELFDLTQSNPTRCGLRYDPSAILAPLVLPEALVYDPDPRGNLAAREAVARYYQSHGVAIDPASLLLTASTSEAYSFLFRLLCNPGDEILVMQPSYPLFDFLAQLDDVRPEPYGLIYDQGWQLDPVAIRRRITPLTRAISVVHPNNPSGHFTRPHERRALEEICHDHGLALIVDEVFLDYSFSTPAESFAKGPHPVLTFVLSGVSKVAALPQMKVAWIAPLGPRSDLAGARLEVIADTFLSVNTPGQCALPAWLEGRHDLERQIRQRTQRNLAALDSILAGQTLITRLDLDAGWYALLRIPALETGEEVAVRLLKEKAVAVHSGHFFGLPEAGWLVVSLLAEEAEFRSGAERVATFFESGPHP